MFPFVVGIRRLADSVLLCFLNLFLILGVLALCEYGLASDGRAPGVETYAVAQDLSVLTFFGAMTNVLYSYAGHWLYFELIAVMRNPANPMTHLPCLVTKRVAENASLRKLRCARGVQSALSLAVRSLAATPVRP